MRGGADQEARAAATAYVEKREKDHLAEIRRTIRRQVEQRYSEEWSREANAFMAGWAACAAAFGARRWRR